VRWGHFEGGHGPIRPLEIDDEPSREEVIVEVIGRLDELGDVIDGEIEDDELSEMLVALAQ
jgi:hypothetical protein